MLKNSGFYLSKLTARDISTLSIYCAHNEIINNYFGIKVVNYNSFHWENELVRIDRFYYKNICSKYLQNVEDQRVHGPELKIEKQVQLLDYQVDIVEKVYNKLIDESGLILELEGGKGKTYIAAAIIQKIGKNALMVVPTIAILNQTIKLFKSLFGDELVGEYHSKKKEIKPIVVTTIASAIDFDFTSNFGITLFDEVHEYSTKEYMKAFTKCATYYMVGLTAESDNRNDRMDVIAHRCCGPVFVYDEIDSDIKYSTTVYVAKNNKKYSFGSYASLLEKLIEDEKRTNYIIKIATDLHSQGINFYVWCELNEKGVDILYEKLKHLEGCRKLTGKTKNGDFEEIIKNAKIIITTYSYSYRGLSIPRFTSMIFATPRKSKIYQILKRIYRSGSDNNVKRIVYDIFDAQLHKQYNERAKEYKNSVFGATIVNFDMV